MSPRGNRLQKITPLLVIALTLFIALLHFKHSRVYNYQIAVVELLILIGAMMVYGRALIKSIPFKSYSFYLLLGLILAYMIASLQSEFLKYGLERSISLSVWIGYFWLVVFLLREKFLKPEHLVVALATTCVLPLLGMGFQYWNLQPITQSEFIAEHLHSYSNIRHVSYHVLAAYFFSLYFFVIQRQRRQIHWLIVGLLLSLAYIYFMVWSGSRQGILLILLFTPVVFLVFYRPNIKTIVWLTSLLLTGILFILLFADADSALGKMTTRLLDLDDLLIGGGRTKVWEFALELLEGNYLFGIGPDTFHAIREPRTWVVQVHNAPLQFLLESGIFGCLFFLASITLLLIKARQLISRLSVGSSEYNYSMLAFLFLIAYLMNAIVDGIFYHVLPIYMFSMASALLVYQFEEAPA